jgi:protein-S-isoprenylcysteine O-methyltransferase Ste14
MSRPRSHASDTAGVELFPPLVYFVGLAGGYIIWWLLPVPIMPGGGLAIRLVGAAACLAGLALAASALFQFWRAGTPPEPHKPTLALATGGPYRFTRNPMYLGMALGHAGLAIAGNALWPLLTLVPVVWVIRRQVIDREEAYLTTKFGEAYRAFTKRTRRWL